MFEWLLGKRIKVQVPLNVGKAKIKIIDKRNKKYILEIEGRWSDHCLPDLRTLTRPEYVEEVFKEFIDDANKGMVRISDDCFIERSEIKSICMIDREVYDIYKTKYKRVRK